jgi:tetratricopeptide (TPR) repeat protein
MDPVSPPPMSPRFPLALALASLPLLVLPGCKARGEQREQRVVDAVRRGRYAEAREVARRLAEANPKDAAAQVLARDAELAYVLDLGRDEVFHGDLTRGLAHFEEARALAPEHPVVLRWIEKTRAQLATQWLDAAAENTGPEQLDEAERCYEKVLEYSPRNRDALSGLARVLLLQNYRAGMSKTYFDDGLTSFQDLMLEQARREFQISRRYRENEPAGQRAEQVEGLMADERLAQARELEAAGRYFAARNEYRLVLLIDPESAEGRAGLDRMDRETRATTTLAEAEMKVRRGELGAAEDVLAAATLLTDAQKDHVTLLQSDIDARRHDELYRTAESFARDYRYAEAIAAYDELLALDPDFRDAAQRKATLLEFTAMTEEFYANALAAKDDDEAEQWLLAIPVIWPEYKDVDERLAAIEARRAAQAAGGDAPAGTEEPEGAPK